MTRRLLLVFAVLAGCIRLPHVDPLPRPPEVAERAIVRVNVQCVDGGFSDMDPIEWYPPRSGTGIVISERHVLTAAHVVNCPTIPRVTVVFPDGRWQMMDDARNDSMFGSGKDISRLEISSADMFHLNIAPPELAGSAPLNGTAWVGDVYCVQTLHGRLCGSRDLDIPNIVLGVQGIRDGDSGAPVFNDADQLAGIEISSGTLTDGTAFFRYVPITSTWMEGT